MAFPVALIGGLIAGAGGWLAGKSGGGAPINIFSPQRADSTQNTVTNQNTYSSVYSPTINRTFDIQYNIASGYNSSISTKKEQEISQIPNISPSISPTLMVIPTTAQGSGIGTGDNGSFDFMTPLIVAGFVAGGYFLFKKGDKKK